MLYHNMGNVVNGCMGTSIAVPAIIPPVAPQDVGPISAIIPPVAPQDVGPISAVTPPVVPQDVGPISAVTPPVAPQDVGPISAVTPPVVPQPTTDVEKQEKWCQSRALSKLKKESSAFIVHQAVGHFTNTVMPISQLQTIVPETIMHGCAQLCPDLMCKTASVYDIRAIYEQHVVEPDNDKYPYSDSYRNPGPRRIKFYEMTTRTLPKIQSVNKFVEVMRQYQNLPIFVKSDSAKMHPCSYLATTTLHPVHLAPDARRHLWSIENKCNVSTDNRMLSFDERTDGLIPVLATVPIYEYAGSSLKGVMFVLHGAKIMWEQINCCYETFLSNRVRRKCGKHFENLNRTMPLVKPSEPIVGGIVVEKCDGTQIDPIELVIHGITIKLRYLSDPKPQSRDIC